MTGLYNTKNKIYKKKQVLQKPEISYLVAQLSEYVVYTSAITVQSVVFKVPG